MPRGRPAKPAAEHKAAGTFRKSRHKPEPIGPAALDTSPPEGLSPSLASTWAVVVSDLQELGVVMRLDLENLRTVMAHKSNAECYQARIDYMMTDPETSVADLARMQGALASATAAYLRQVEQITRSVKARPKPEPQDDWLKRTTA